MDANLEPVNASVSLRALASLLAYPDKQLRAHLPALREALHAEGALPASRLAELDELAEWLSGAGNAADPSDELEVEAAYVELFDRGRSTCLHLFEHVHGDSRDRGPAMIDLAQTYEKAGLYLAPGELPDYLPVVLEFVSTQPPREARDFLAEMAHIFNVMYSALRQRQSGYAGVLGALLDLAGETAQPVEFVAEEPLDASWSEPAVFGGCSSQGQVGPGQAQPIQILRKDGLNRNALTRDAINTGVSA